MVLIRCKEIADARKVFFMIQDREKIIKQRYEFTDVVDPDILWIGYVTPAPNSPPTLAASYDGTKITVTWGDIPGVMPSQFVRVWLFSEQKLVHKQMVDFAPGAAKTMNITTVNGAKGGAIDITALQGTAMLIQADAIDQATGWASNPSRTLRLMLTPPTP